MSIRNKLSIGLKLLTERRYRRFFGQRLTTDLLERSHRADALAAKLPPAPTSAILELAQQVESLDTEGYVVLPPIATPTQIADMFDYFAREPCSDPYRKHLGSFVAPAGAPEEVHVAFFDNERALNAPHALAIANHPRVLAIAGAMLGAKPTISLITAWWSLPTKAGQPEEAERFHRDVDDWRFVKLFLYLTDVDDTAGPHIFATGSHRVNSLTKLRRYDDAEVHAAFGENMIRRFTGPAGMAFLENTGGLHRGLPPAKRPRLIFQVLYSLRPTIYGPKRPIKNVPHDGEGVQLDSYTNRVYCRVADANSFR